MLPPICGSNVTDVPFFYTLQIYYELDITSTSSDLCFNVTGGAFSYHLHGQSTPAVALSDRPLSTCPTFFVLRTLYGL